MLQMKQSKAPQQLRRRIWTSSFQNSTSTWYNSLDQNVGPPKPAHPQSSSFLDSCHNLLHKSLCRPSVAHKVLCRAAEQQSATACAEIILI